MNLQSIAIHHLHTLPNHVDSMTIRLYPTLDALPPPIVAPTATNFPYQTHTKDPYPPKTKHDNDPAQSPIQQTKPLLNLLEYYHVALCHVVLPFPEDHIMSWSF